MIQYPTTVTNKEQVDDDDDDENENDDNSCSRSFSGN
jgi:hypothetical protein